MDTLFTTIHCLDCDHPQVADPFAARCPACGSTWLDARYDYGALPPRWCRRVSRRAHGLYRYHELLPLHEVSTAVSLGEGWTPLVRAPALAEETGPAELWIKDERQQPTGSFKDRQAALTVSALHAERVDELVVATTGNAGISYAAYCAREVA